MKAEKLWIVSVGHKVVQGQHLFLFHQVREPSLQEVRVRAAAHGMDGNDLKDMRIERSDALSHWLAQYGNQSELASFIAQGGMSCDV